MGLLELVDVKVRYGAIAALKGVSVTVEDGEIVTLLGANGAGKTTTLRTVSGLLRPYAGEVIFEGARIDGMPAHQVVALGIGHSPEARRVFPRMTVVENLQMGAYRFGRARKEDLDRVFTLFPILLERRTQDAGTLSGGEQQMLAIGRALMSAPKLLLVDELSLGLMPKMVDLCIDALQTLNREEGLAIVLVEQNTARALDVAHQVCVLASGRSVFTGSAESARRDVDLLHSYTGVAA